jgi:hypothetical protein
MTAYTILEAVWITTHTFQHRVITLVLEHGHVVTPHKVGIGNALITFPLRNIGSRHIACRHSHSQKTEQRHRA